MIPVPRLPGKCGSFDFARKTVGKLGADLQMASAWKKEIILGSVIFMFMRLYLSLKTNLETWSLKINNDLYECVKSLTFFTSVYCWSPYSPLKKG
jgi:hypothetical protein